MFHHILLTLHFPNCFAAVIFCRFGCITIRTFHSLPLACHQRPPPVINVLHLLSTSSTCHQRPLLSTSSVNVCRHQLVIHVFNQLFTSCTCYQRPIPVINFFYLLSTTYMSSVSFACYHCPLPSINVFYLFLKPFTCYQHCLPGSCVLYLSTTTCTCYQRPLLAIHILYLNEHQQPFVIDTITLHKFIKCC